MSTKKMTFTEWKKLGASLFGPSKLDWKFVCPSCGHIAKTSDWLDAGAKEGEVAFSCVGRHPKTEGDRKKAADAAFGKRGGPCNYAGGGLFQLNPVVIDFEDGGQPGAYFDFAYPEKEQVAA